MTEDELNAVEGRANAMMLLRMVPSEAETTEVAEDSLALIAAVRELQAAISMRETYIDNLLAQAGVKTASRRYSLMNTALESLARGESRYAAVSRESPSSDRTQEGK